MICYNIGLLLLNSNTQGLSLFPWVFFFCYNMDNPIVTPSTQRTDSPLGAFFLHRTMG